MHRRPVVAAVTGVVVALAGGTAAVATTSSSDRAIVRQADRGDEDEDTVAPRAVETLTGTLAKQGGDYLVGTTKLGLGPRWYRDKVIAPADFDADGTNEVVAVELDGLVGRTVTLQVMSDDATEATVLTVNGLTYRSKGKPPWAGGPKKAGVDPRSANAAKGAKAMPPDQAKKGGSFTPPGQAKKHG